MSRNDPAPRGPDVGSRGRGAPARPAAARMGDHVDPDVKALATSVHTLVLRRFPTRPWRQLTALLDAAERDALGGGDDRRICRYMSAQFGARARRGPGAAMIRVVLRVCLQSLDSEQEREATRAEILRLFAVVTGGQWDAGSTPQPLAESGTTTLEPADNARLLADNTQLRADLEAAQLRIKALEALLAATPARVRPVGINAGEERSTALVRPYTRAHEQRTSAPAVHQEPPGDETTQEVPGTPLLPGPPYRVSNSPRFPALRPVPQYPANLDVAAPHVPATPRIPRPRAVGRAPVPAASRIPWLPPGALPTGSLPTGSLPTGSLPTGDAAVTDILPWPLVGVRQLGAQERERAEVRRLARLRAAHLLREVWADQWADLPDDEMPPDRCGYAQIPLLLTACGLAALISTIPSLLA
ncbi:hypothetical protein [Actinoplanes sp. RD1]|uniref:hypothetical protein n=1 Tax=Actinoplanes sp. RD1 TaxID=3064538 RepID=UPI0027421E10|nr:hypothetical protein [Actinoplanes sp. RD1]